MPSWLGCKSPMRLALKILKHTVALNSSLTKFVGVRSQTWRLSTLSQCSHPHGREVQKLLHWPCTSPAKCACRCTGVLAALLALPARAAEKVLVYSHDLYCPKLTLENDQVPAGDLQVKETLEISAGPELRDWRFPYVDYALYDILPDDPKVAAAIRRKAPKIYYNAITRTLYRRSHDGIILHCLS